MPPRTFASFPDTPYAAGDPGDDAAQGPFLPYVIHGTARYRPAGGIERSRHAQAQRVPEIARIHPIFPEEYPKIALR